MLYHNNAVHRWKMQRIRVSSDDGIDWNRWYYDIPNYLHLPTKLDLLRDNDPSHNLCAMPMYVFRRRIISTTGKTDR